jgi:hypothetical protein
VLVPREDRLPKRLLHWCPERTDSPRDCCTGAQRGPTPQETSVLAPRKDRLPKRLLHWCPERTDSPRDCCTGTQRGPTPQETAALAPREDRLPKRLLHWRPERTDSPRDCCTGALSNRCFCLILGIRWPFIINNTALREATGKEDIATQTARRKWRWLGSRKPADDLTRHALQWNLQ